MYQAIKDHIEAHGIKKAAIAAYLGISQPTLKSRLSGQSDWKAGEILALSKWWNVPAEKLLSDGK